MINFTTNNISDSSAVSITSSTRNLVSIFVAVALGSLSFLAFLIYNACRKLIGRKIEENALSPEQKTTHLIAMDRISASPLPQAESILTEKATKVKKQNAAQLKDFESWILPRSGGVLPDWGHFKPSRAHYDWWTFPVQRASSYGLQYAVNDKDVESLKKDPEFMVNFRRGVELVLNSWGLDPVKDSPIPESIRYLEQQWEGYGVRLGKMADSLLLFGEQDLYASMQNFFLSKCRPLDRSGTYPLDPWVIKACSHKLCLH